MLILDTTRPIRRGEMDGVDYYFVQNREQMERDLANNVFVEAGVYGDHLYGMSAQSVMTVAQQVAYHYYCFYLYDESAYCSHEKYWRTINNLNLSIYIKLPVYIML